MQDEGWKLNRNHYYQEGWLSTANLRGVVGVTYTTSHCGLEGFDSGSVGGSHLKPPARTNYNLRGHRAEVTLVQWNEPYQKLASCDTSGIIFVWIKYEGVPARQGFSFVRIQPWPRFRIFLCAQVDGQLSSSTTETHRSSVLPGPTMEGWLSSVIRFAYSAALPSCLS